VHKKINNTAYIWIVPVLVLMLALSACGSANADATPTMSVDAIFTAAFQTLSAQQATQLALTPPTETPLPSPSPTLASLPTQSGGFLFGSPTASGGAVGCDSSSYVKDVTIPDGTIMDPGKSFIKTWSLLNNGTCNWSTSYQLTFVTGNQMNGATTAIPNAVPAGQQAQVSVSLTAPATAGSYTGWWRMQNDKGQYFGNSISVVITVSGSTTATNTSSGATNTSAPSTNTPLPPTNTPTLTPTP